MSRSVWARWSLLAVALLVPCLTAQVSRSGSPAMAFTPATAHIHTVKMGAVAVKTLLAEDQIADGPGMPVRFGHAFDVNYGLTNAGTWIALPGRERLWRLRIECPGAYSINLLYDTFWLPEGATLFIYTEDHVLGAFTAENNKRHGRFATGPTPGDACVVEYYEPAAVAGRGRLRISRIVHGYKNLFGWREKDGFGSSGECNVNVNCPEGAAWGNEIRSVAVIVCGGGTRCCSGALINNVTADQVPYFLTANHCLFGHGDEMRDVETWIFMFNYESPGCANADGPTTDTVSGATLVARSADSDFALLRLSEIPPPWYGVYYAGWSAEEIAPEQSTTIHHPQGDIKKISFDYDPALSVPSPWEPVEEETHWEVNWEVGTTESGSSGSPLFDQNHRVVGQLSGGYASCIAPLSDYYGKLSYSWESGATAEARLKDWLDPEDSGRLSIDGLAPGDAPPVVEITSPGQDAVVAGTVDIQVLARDDVGVAQVAFLIDGSLALTDLQAPYEYRWETAELPAGPYTVEVVATDTGGFSGSDTITVRVEPDCNGNDIPDFQDIALGSSQDCNENGVPDECDIADGTAEDTNTNGIPDVCEDLAPFLRGDVNADGQRDIADGIALLMYLFLESGTPPCMTACDANDDGFVDISDPIAVLNHLFAGGSIPEPFDACAPDPTDDPLECLSFPPCMEN